MLLVDARRLTGPSHLAGVPLVLVELALDAGETAARALALYLEELGRLRAAVGLAPEVDVVTREHRGGCVFGYPAPIDEMLACADMSEWAAVSACARARGDEPLSVDDKRDEITAALERERNPARAALLEEAERRGLPVLWDDELTSVGLGCRSVSYANDAIPAPSEVPWRRLGTIPVALVTGTNGKTTSSRLLAHLATQAGFAVGSTSSDGVLVGGRTVEEGDWTGPAAARLVLRDPSVELAVLETARGGILRRGLAVDSCDAALLTNVGADHVGSYGIDDVNAMTRVKGVVAEIVPASGTAALNAHDPNLVAFAEGLRARVVLFADLDGPRLEGMAATREALARHRAEGGASVVAEGGLVVLHEPSGPARTFGYINDLPITFGGAARYNVENALGAVAAAVGLGLPDDAIRAGLATFRNEDNPGRGQVLERGGVRVLLDFGHNPEGVRAVMSLARALLAERGGHTLTVITGSAGDRRDADVEGIARAVVEGGATRVFLREIAGYLRGRAPGEVPGLLRRALVEAGLDEGSIALAEGEVDALDRAIATSGPGDLVALLIHVETEAVQAYLATSRPT